MRRGRRVLCFQPSRLCYGGKKVAGGALDEAPPIINRSPPRKLTAQDQKDFYVPAAISNWKNANGYTIPLHMRLQADGRSL